MNHLTDTLYTLKTASDTQQELKNWQSLWGAQELLTDNLKFKDLLKTLEPRYPVPGRASIHKELECVLIELKAKISAYIKGANKISICWVGCVVKKV